MSIEPLLEQCRNEYQIHLRQAVSAERLKDPDLVTELAMRINGDSWNERSLLVRIDIVGGDPDQLELMNAESHPVETSVGEVALETVIGDMPVKVTKFSWDHCVVSLNPLESRLLVAYMSIAGSTWRGDNSLTTTAWRVLFMQSRSPNPTKTDRRRPSV